MTWSELPFPGTVNAVAADRDRLVAVGPDGEGLAAWVSSDGTEWERHAVPAAETDQEVGGGGPGPLARLGDTLYSFGTFSGAGDFRRPVGWRSADGESWEYISSTNPFFAAGGISHLVAGHDALVAATDRGLVAPYQSVWSWSPATSWMETDLRSTADRSLLVYDIAWNNGTYFALGATFDPATEAFWEDRTLGGWLSGDGQAWVETALPDGLQEPCALAPMPGGGFFLTGEEAGGIGIWTSADDAAWSELAHLDEGNGECWQRVIPFEDGGFFAMAQTTDGLVLSTSADGVAWEHARFPDLSSTDRSAAVLGNTIVVFANRSLGEEGSETVVLLGSPD